MILLLLYEEDTQSGPAAPSGGSTPMSRPEGPPESWTLAERQAYVRGDFD